MSRSTPSPELRRFVDRLLDGENLSRTEMARLEDLLDQEENLDYYVSITSQEGLMPEALASMVASATSARPATKKVVRFPWRPLVQAAAACAIFAIGWHLGTRRMPVAAPDKTVAATPARITGMVGVEWQDGQGPDLLSTGAATRRLAVKSGLVEVTYSSGVRLTLEGPADFTVNDSVSGQLDAGKLVASVPKGAEGFRVNYSKGNVVDLGTEFAMDARKDGTVELGVLDGKVNLNLPGEPPRLLLVDQAVIHRDDVSEPLLSIPFDREKYVRHLPARDFPWSVSSFESKQLEFDVTHLIWKGANYRVIFKWINARSAVVIRGIGLYCDGDLVAEDRHVGQTGVIRLAKKNLFQLNLPADRFRRGRWTIRTVIEPLEHNDILLGESVLSEGILQLEEGMVTTAGPEDFIGKWSYSWTGHQYVREFLPDGTVTLTCDGKMMLDTSFTSRWKVNKGVLRVSVHGSQLAEEHVLRDPSTLVFINQPYGNAVKMK